MGRTQKKIKKRVPKIATKREKAHKRVLLVKKALLVKKKARQQRHRKSAQAHRKNELDIDEQIVDLPDPRTSTVALQSEFDILGMLGLLDSSIGQTEMDCQLQKKLQDISSKSVENPQVRRVYGEIGKIFCTYRSGKIPKAFKVIPNLQKWREVLKVTRPEDWTPQAMFQAVNIFASNFDPVRAESFYREYLVPAVKTDLKKSRKLNYHYFESLRKALYKTNAWFKGILFQFCSTDTLLRQIKVIESLLTRMSIPVISSSVAMVKMMEMPPSAAIIHYLLALMGKNYSFPKKVITSLCPYLLSFEAKEEDLPVIWHQLFLNLVKQYGGSLDQMSKSALSDLARKKHHKLISPEIIRLLS